MGNVYIPPTGNLPRRSLTESIVREKVEDILGSIPADIPAVLCGDFNARTAEHAPTVNDAVLQRSSADLTCCPRGKWFLE